MNAQRRTYASRRDKTLDLLFGLGLFLGGNIALVSLVLAVNGASQAILPKNSESGGWFALAFFCLPPVANIAAWIYFLLTRRWVALGMTAGLIACASCLLIGYALLIASGFSLV